MKKLLIVFLIFLSSCNGGRSYFYFDDVVLNKDGLLTKINEKRPQEQKIVRLGDFSGMSFYEKNMTTKDKEIFINTIKKSNATKKKCVYILSYFLPINFWTFFGMDSEKMAKEAITDFNKKNQSNNIMKNVGVMTYWLGTPIISYDCKIIAGEIEVKNGSN